MASRLTWLLLVSSLCGALSCSCDTPSEDESVGDLRPPDPPKTAAVPAPRAGKSAKPPPPPFRIDIKLRGKKNIVRLSAKNPLRFAALGSSFFDVKKINTESLSFGPASTRMLHDLTDPKQVQWHYRDLTGDGHVDLMLHVTQRETGLGLNARKACLRGALINGNLFVVCDEVEIRY
jgi:hypothetical protein